MKTAKVHLSGGLALDDAQAREEGHDRLGTRFEQVDDSTGRLARDPAGARAVLRQGGVGTGLALRPGRGPVAGAAARSPAHSSSAATERTADEAKMMHVSLRRAGTLGRGAG